MIAWLKNLNDASRLTSIKKTQTRQSTHLLTAWFIREFKEENRD